MRKARWNKKYLIFVFMIFLVILVFSGVLFSSSRLLCPEGINDVNAFFYSCWRLNAQILKEGIILWNPFRFCGEPWFANPQNQIWYPPSFLLTLFLPAHLGINYCFVLHILLSGLGMYLFARSLKIGQYGSLVAGIVFMFSPHVFLRLFAGHVNTLCVYAYIPWIFLFLEMGYKRRLLKYILLAGMILSFQILAGNPQFTYYTIFSFTLYLAFLAARDVYKNRKLSCMSFFLKIFFISVVIALGIAAVKILPNIELTKLSNRQAKDIALAGSWALPKENLLTIILPEIFGNIVNLPYFGQYNYWEMCAYAGVVVLCLSMMAVFMVKRNKSVAFFLFLAVFSLVSALSIHTPLFYLYYYFLPGFGFFRGHNKFLVLFIFSISVLSGWGCRFLLSQGSSAKRKIYGFSIALFLISILFSTLYYLFIKSTGFFLNWAHNFTPFVAEEFLSIFRYGLCLSLKKSALFLLATGGIFYFYATNRIKRPGLKFLIISILIFELLNFGTKYIKTTSLEKFYWDREVVEFLRKDKMAFRTLALGNWNLFSNNGLLSELQDITGYDPLQLKIYNEHFSAINFSFAAGNFQISNWEPLNLANLKYIITPSKRGVSGLKKIFANKDHAVFKNENCQPRAFMVYTPDSFKKNMLYFNSDKIKNEVLVCEYTPNRIILEAEAKEGGFLVLNDAFYPGWQAFVKHKNTKFWQKREVIQANILFRAIALEKGDYIIKFIFRPLSLYMGLIISLMSVVVWCFLRFKLKNFWL